MMNPFLLLAFVSFAVILARKAWSVLNRAWTSPLLSLPGPKSPSFIYGHFKEIFNDKNSMTRENWAAEYGKTFKYYTFGNMPRLFTMDTRAVNHILTHSEYYPKPAAERMHLARILGQGLLVVEGEKHRQQRRIMNPAFGPAQLRALTPIFNQKSIELRDVILSQISKTDSEEPLRVDMLFWLSRATLDIIGLAGFGYAFDAMKSDENELANAFGAFRGGGHFNVLSLLEAVFPVVGYIPTASGKRLDRPRAVVKRIGGALVEERKLAFTNSGKASEMNTGKDLLSLLVKANMEVKQGMSDDDVLAQIPTFLGAGHDTTTAATTWALYALSLNHAAQTKLREELYTLNTDAPGMDEIKTLSYLDCVVRETMRLHAPITGTVRQAMRDDVLPTEDGSLLRIGKGDSVFIPILAMNRSKEIWGEDSLEFKPERWASVPEGATNMPGVWGNVLSFSGGSRACIGYQFSIVEMKCLLFTLIRSFEFKLAVPEDSIMTKFAIVQRPIVKGEEEYGSQLPLFVKAYSHI